VSRLPGYRWLPLPLQRLALDREGARDANRLEREVEGLAGSLAARHLDAELQEAYRSFAALPGADTVGAVSLELARFLLALCRCRRPCRVADLGSGFSAWLFRRWAEEEANPVSVVSVDDDPAWLECSRAFVAGRGLPDDGFIGWPQFRAGSAPFDLILWDYGDVRTRAELLPVVAARLSHGGVLLCDDVHKRRVLRSARACARRSGLVTYSLRAHTLDPLGRYALLARRPGGAETSEGRGSV
jgi:predicted O-methyltransferase YrrM